MPQDSDELAPSTKDFMLNLAGDDMGGFIARLTANGVPVLKCDQDAFGKYA